MAKIVIVAAAVAASLVLLYRIRSVVALVFIAIFIAVALGRPVDFVERLGLKRWLAILTAYLAMLLAVFVVGLLVVPPIVSQTNKFVKNVPHYVDDLRNNKTIRDYDKKYHVTAKLKEGATKLPAKLGTAVGALQDVTVGVFSALVQLVTVLVLTFFLLLDGKRIVNWVFDELGPARGPRAGPSSSNAQFTIRFPSSSRKNASTSTVTSWTSAENTPTVTLWSAPTASSSLVGSLVAPSFSFAVTWYFLS